MFFSRPALFFNLKAGFLAGSSKEGSISIDSSASTCLRRFNWSSESSSVSFWCSYGTELPSILASCDFWSWPWDLGASFGALMMGILIKSAAINGFGLGSGLVGGTGVELLW